ncbi:VirC2 family conjugal transfer protein [Haematobacter genomosp. 1]|uniref:Uncharacterized protein n=1 Tax=Haematobacter genomosp. 1 TaxID=366618 RepID=A0A212A787_9RHOB|nr:VirC2 family conjugal transfer protein [Haematobacter genomosp. 1]OWJ75042.1 hypothetical protein CDV49_18145 [Haematobacter genomosp. 1]
MMAKQFKKYGVDHSALYEAVNRDNRYHDDKAKPAPVQQEGVATPLASDTSPPVKAGDAGSGDAKPDVILPTPPVTPEPEGAQPTPKTPPPAPVESQPKQESAPKKAPPAETGGTNIPVRMRPRFPADGVSPSYDSLARDHGPELAFKAIFRRAFDEYRALMDAGSLPNGPRDYAIGKGSHSSTKMLTASQYQLCMETLDPNGLLPPMTVGRIIAERALALFFEKDRRTNAG